MPYFQPDVHLNKSNLIKVIGVGGGGSNAVNHMFKHGIEGVDFYICNTDVQALHSSPVPFRIQLGVNLTEGLGAGSMPDMGEKAAMESVMSIRQLLEDGTKMVFITAGMGGGTGTGAAPVIAKIAKECNILTVGIVTLPFEDEGPQRIAQAREGLDKLKPHVDALITICNDRIVDMYGDLTISQAFSKADDILCTAARGIAEIITKPGQINVDFMDVQTAVSNSGRAILGTGIASGANRAEDAARMALDSPLLDNVKIRGAKHLLVNFTYGEKEPVMSEISKVKRYLQEEAGHSAHLKMGITKDENLTDEITITVIATGFEVGNHPAQTPQVEPSAIGQIQLGVWPNEANNQPTHGESEVVSNQPLSTHTPSPQVPSPQQNQGFGLSNNASINSNSPVNHNDLFSSTPQFNAFGMPINNNDSVNQWNPIDHHNAMNPIDKIPMPIESLNDMFNENPLSEIFREQHLEKHRGNRNNILDDIDVPAYLRKGINLQSAPPSQQQLVSKITIQEENSSADRDLTIKPNRHLHDNVD